MSTAYIVHLNTIWPLPRIYLVYTAECFGGQKCYKAYL